MNTMKKYFNFILLLGTLVMFISLVNYFESKFEQQPTKQDSLKTKKVYTILLWNSFFGRVDYNFGLGSKVFRDKNCSYTNCYITNRRNVYPMTSYDAIVFHGAEYMNPTDNNRPSSRSPHQRYVYLSMESPANRPASTSLSGFFNLTATYRLDSDIMMPYFYIADNSGQIVAPSCNPEWMKPTKDPETLSKYKHIFDKKKKPVAWFTSNCHSMNGREVIVKQLQNYISVDVYGDCGPLKCPRNSENICFNKLKDDYFFYLSFENSNCVDYVTEKATNGLINDIIPVVYGEANYTKFLPPSSYIDGKSVSVKQLADKMKFLMNNWNKYVEYFWWKDFYNLAYWPNPFCRLCEILNTNEIGSQSYDIYKWWHGTREKPMCRPHS